VERRDAALIIFKAFDNPTTIAVLGQALEKAAEPIALIILDIYKNFTSIGGMAEPINKAATNSAMSVRLKAVELAGSKQLKGSEPTLIAACKADAFEMRVAAAHAIKVFGDKKLAVELYPLLSDREGAVRNAAIVGVAMLKDRGATKDLVALLSHDDKETVQNSIIGIRELFPSSAKKYGNKASTWKVWWTRYNNQKQFVDYVRSHEQKITDLLGNQDNKSYKQVLEIINADTGLMTSFLSGKFSYTEGEKAMEEDVIPELMEDHAPGLKELQGKMNKWKYDAQKLQTN
jgi:hypothetical protein